MKIKRVKTKRGYVYKKDNEIGEIVTIVLVVILCVALFLHVGYKIISVITV